MRARNVKFQRCGAKTRKGRPCVAPPVLNPESGEPRNGRCRVHGGLSTGPRKYLPDGRPRVPVPTWAEAGWLTEFRMLRAVERERVTVEILSNIAGDQHRDAERAVEDLL